MLGLRRLGLVVVLVLAGVYAAGGLWWWPQSRFGFWAGTALMLVGPAVGGALAIGRGLRLSGRARSSWLLLGSAACAWAAGQFAYSWYEVVLGTAPPFPGPPDAGFLVAVVLLAVGAFRYPSLSRRRWSLTRSGLDGAMIMVSVLLLSWVFVLGSAYETTGVGWFERAVAMAYPAGDVLIISVLLILVRRAAVGGREALGTLLVAMALMVVGDTGYLLLTAQDAYSTGSPIDIGWWAGLLLVGLAALAYRDEPVETDRDPLRPRAIMVPYVVTMVALGVIALHSLVGAKLDLFELASGAVLVALLLARQSVVALDSGHLAQQLRLREDELFEHAYHDPLTRLPNRRSLRDKLDAEIASGLRGEAVLFIDLDGFKAVNDSLGHEAGDVLLQEASNRLRLAVRGEDMVARLGGDEFAVILAAGSDPALAAERLLARVREPFEVSGTTVSVTASIGIALWDGQQAGEELLRNADLAMYRAKTSGRDQASGYEPILHEQARHQLELHVALRQALDQGDFRLVYQPLVALSTGRMIGVEALVRWQRGDRLVPPAEFLDVAEETGLIVPLGDWVLDQACADLASWQAARPAPEITLAVNLAQRQLADGEFPRRVLDTLGRRGIPPHQLTLEITEGVALDGDSQVQAVLCELARLGVQFSLDDFGTGYASLSSLQRLPVGTVKIDRSFVAQLGAHNSPLVDGISYLADRLGLTVVAEGVETQRQRDRLRETGIPYAQGYHFARPMPATDLADLLGQQDEPTDRPENEAERSFDTPRS